MTTPQDKALLALRLLVEGCSIRAIERTTELHRDTILKLLVLTGEKCEKLMGRLIVNVPWRDVQCDEIWAFVSKKEGHKLPMEAHNDSIGDAYCFVAIERYTKLVLNFALGRRSQATTDVFIEGLRAATSPQRFQISTDGFQPYLSAITTTLSDRCDFAQLIKVGGDMADDWIDDLKSKDAGEGDDVRRHEEIQLHNDRTIRAKAPEFWKALAQAVHADCAKLQHSYPGRPNRQAKVTQERPDHFVLEGDDVPIRAISPDLNLDGRFIRTVKSSRDEIGQGPKAITEQIKIRVQSGDSLVFKTEEAEFLTVQDFTRYLFGFVLDLSE